MCLVDLRNAGAKFELLPDRVFSPGCTAVSSVKLVAVGIPVTNLGAVRCGLAVPLTQWVQTAVQQSARAWLDSPVVKIESYGSYACRPVNNMAGNKLSEHASANAVDISGFVLANGRRITVKQHWNGPDPNARNFLRALHQAACRRFRVVIGPNANALHHDHFHFDMGRGPYCR
ncbi:MAG: extensin family protein [Sphingomonadaceae bacterium]